MAANKTGTKTTAKKTTAKKVAAKKVAAKRATQVEGHLLRLSARPAKLRLVDR